MTRRSGAIPPVLRDALESAGGNCYRHCTRPVRSRQVTSLLPGVWRIRACPTGVVSVTSYAEWTGRNPTRAVGAALRRWTFPPSMVRSRDLRLATRHGPELGRPAERFLAPVRPARGIRVVYWRVYPFRARDGSEQRLFVCFRRTHSGPVFYAGPTSGGNRGCPICARHDRTRGTVRGTTARGRR
ncbi:MAG: hypothetical protein WBF81_03480 [Thermoplasmata archaeon]